MPFKFNLRHCNEVSHKLHINTLKGHTDAVNMVAFSGDGGAVVTACDDMTVRLFRLDGRGVSLAHNRPRVQASSQLF